MLIKNESIYYDTLEELNETYKSGNKDVENLKTKYGPNVLISRIMHPEGISPRYEMVCCTLFDPMETIKNSYIAKKCKSH